MSDLDDYEQSEKVRSWLAQNWPAIVIGISVGIGGIFGYRWWESRAVEVAAEAQGKYQELVKAVEDGKPADEIAALKSTLQQEYSDTPYAVFAALREAQSALVAGDLEAAEKALTRARGEASEPALAEVATLRLAEVKLARGEAEAALDLAKGIESVAFKSAAAAVRGDALVALGRRDEARAAYDEALTTLDSGSPSRNFLEMKRNEVAVPDAGAGT